MSLARISIAVLFSCSLASAAWAQDKVVSDQRPVEKWVNSTESAAGASPSAKDEAVRNALRKAVEQATGVFVKAESDTRDYKLTYDKVFADAAGYVKEYHITSTSTEGDTTTVTVRALVSTKKFESDWAAIAHTLQQEGNPRVMFIIEESVFPDSVTTMPVAGGGVVSHQLQDLFNSKGVKVIDRQTAGMVSDRDRQLASYKDDAAEMAAVGARFHADVVIIGKAQAKYSGPVRISGADFHRFTASLALSAIQTDSALVLASKSYNATKTTNMTGGGGDLALAELVNANGEDVLKVVCEAWRKRAQVSRTFEVNISGMDFNAYKQFEKEASEIRGLTKVDLKEITESVANVLVEYQFDHKRLATVLSEMKGTKLEVAALTTNRISLKVVK